MDIDVGAAGPDETAEHLPEVHRIHQDVLIDLVTSLSTGKVTLLTLLRWCGDDGLCCNISNTILFIDLQTLTLITH